MGETGCLTPTSQTLQKLLEHLRIDRTRSMKQNSPWTLTADTQFMEERRPVALSTSVRPTGAQVMPAWRSRHSLRRQSR